MRCPLDQDGITRFTYMAEQVLCTTCGSVFYDVEVTGMFKPESYPVFVHLCSECFRKPIRALEATFVAGGETDD